MHSSKSRHFEEFVRTLQARRNAERETERLRTSLANGETPPRRTPPQDKNGMNIAKTVGKEAIALSEIKALKTRVKAIVKERK